MSAERATMTTTEEESAGKEEKEEKEEAIGDSVKSARIDQRESIRRIGQDAITKKAEKEREGEEETTAINDPPIT